MERLDSAGVHVLCLSKHQGLSNNLASSICHALTPGANSGLVTIPIMSALSVAFPGASSVSVSVLLHNGLLATVGNLLKVGPANVGFSSTTDTVAGIAAATTGGVSTTSKAGRLAMVTGARAEHQCTYMTSLPVYSIACSSEQDRALILAHLASCGGEQLQKTLWRPERCVGSVTLGMSPRIQQSPELQEKCFSNLLMLSMSLSFDIGAAAYAVQRATSAFTLPVNPSAPPPCSPCRRPCITACTHAPPPAAPEDVEAEQSYSDLDEDYLAELAREASGSDEDEERVEEEGASTSAGCAATAHGHRYDDDHRCDPSASVLHVVGSSDTPQATVSGDRSVARGPCSSTQPPSPASPPSSKSTESAAANLLHAPTYAAVHARKQAALMTMLSRVLSQGHSVACLVLCAAALIGLLCSARSGGGRMMRQRNTEQQTMLLLLVVALLTQLLSSMLPVPMHVGGWWLSCMAWAPVLCLVCGVFLVVCPGNNSPPPPPLAKSQAGPGMSWLPCAIGVLAMAAFPQLCLTCNGNTEVLLRILALVAGRFVVVPMVMAMCMDRIVSLAS